MEAKFDCVNAESHESTIYSWRASFNLIIITLDLIRFEAHPQAT